MPQETHSSKNASSTATEKLKSIGLKPISWYGTCEANRVSTGTYDVPKNEGGMYALVFDNTFAKSFAKSATFVLLTYPTGSPPQSNHHMHHIQGGSSETVTSLKDISNPKKEGLTRGSSDPASQIGSSNSASQRVSDECKHRRRGASEVKSGSNFFTGVLLKKRRKKNQGWARRFFSLDYTSSTLSYYQNSRTQAVRGTVPLSMAAIGANAATRQISIDSGAEVWHLKAANQRAFDSWKRALELARSCASPTTPASATRTDALRGVASTMRTSLEEEQDWVKVEDLVARLKGSRDAARSLAVDTDPKYLPQTQSHTPIDPALNRKDSAPISAASSTGGSPAEQSLPNGYFAESDRRPFWKRKPTTDRSMPGMYRSVSATPSTQSIRAAPPTPIRTSSFGKTLQSHPEEERVHDRCLSLLRDLDSIVASFSRLIAENKEHRTPVIPPITSRQSIDTQGDDEFFDAEGGSSSQLLDIHHESEEEGEEAERGFATDEDSASASDVDEPTIPGQHSAGLGKATPAFPPKPKSLTPLPAQWVKRRTAVNAPTATPPSLVSFMRKNVGKDLSTISMPVTANEPISALQRFAEVVEYSSLLDDAAANKPRSSIERLIYVTAFAVSYLSCIRVKERAIRKPFNPMLGETFELVREDRGLRFLAEKVSHRPVRLAYQAENEQWTLTQSPLPTQKFWGKSAELITEGRTRLILHSTGDRFSWAPGSSFLRNIIAGEKYVEPVGDMTIVNEVTGEKAIVTFKTKGMFSGRSEDVTVQTYDSYGDVKSLGLVGKWTSSLTATENGNSRANEPPIWSVAELIPDAAKRYGFTTFAASLNEITPIEKGKLPPTDSRLRPDQRAAEDGDFDEAEMLKGKLEEAQRKRRKILEDEGSSWTPKWFEKVEGGDGSGEEVWVAKAGQDSYWEKRINSEWEDVEKIFDL